jgi:hypothetical protein
MKRRIKKLHSKLAAFVPVQVNAISLSTGPAAPESFSPTLTPPSPTAQLSRRAPTKIELSLPDDDIPSVEAVIAELSGSGAELPIFTEPVVDIGNVIAATTPGPSDPPPDDTRTKAHEVRKPMTRKAEKPRRGPLPEPEREFVPLSIPVQAPVSVSVPARAAAAAAARSVAVAAMSITDPEEITVVTSPRSKPIRIDISSSPATAKRARARQAISQAPADVLFFPTLLGGFPTGRADDSSEEGQFAPVYNTLSDLRSVLSGGTLMIGCGLVAIASVFFFGNQFIAGSSSADSTAGPTTEKISSQPVGPAQFAPSVTSAKMPATIAEKPKTVESDVVSNSSKAPTVKDKLSPKDKKVGLPVIQNSKNSKDNEPFSPVNQSSKTIPAKTPLQAPYTETRAAIDRRPMPTPVKPTGTTRPRIVKNPKP